MIFLKLPIIMSFLVLFWFLRERVFLLVLGRLWVDYNRIQAICWRTDLLLRIEVVLVDFIVIRPSACQNLIFPQRDPLHVRMVIRMHILILWIGIHMLFYRPIITCIWNQKNRLVVKILTKLVAFWSIQSSLMKILWRNKLGIWVKVNLRKTSLWSFSTDS